MAEEPLGAPQYRRELLAQSLAPLGLDLLRSQLRRFLSTQGRVARRAFRVL
jgi:hypothetical protein